MMALPTSTAELRNKQVPQGAVDPNVKIPKQILDAGQRSEAIQRAVAGEAEPSVAAQVEKQAENGHDQTPPQGEAPVQELSKQGELPLQPPPEDEASWERKFKSLEGRYESQLRRARESVTQLSQRLEQVENERNAMRNGHVEEVKPPAALSEQEIADYGPEFV